MKIHLLKFNIVLCLFLLQTSYAQNEKQQAKLDSLMSSLKTTNETGYISTLVELGNYYINRKTRNIDSLKYYGELIVKESDQRDNFKNFKADGLYALAIHCIFEKKYTEAIDFAKELEEIAKQHNYSLGLVKANKAYAYAYRALGKPQLYMGHLNSAYAYSQSDKIKTTITFDLAVDLSTAYIEYNYAINPTSNMLLEVMPLLSDPAISFETKGIYFQNLGYVYYLNKDYANAIKYFRLSIDNFKLDGDPYYVFVPMVNLSESLKEYESYEESIKLLNEALSLKLPHSYSDIYYGLGTTYYEIEDFDKSESFFLKAIEYLQDEKRHNQIGNCYKYLGEIYTAQGNKQLAQKSLTLAKEAFLLNIEKNQSKGVNYRLITDSYLNLADIYELGGDYERSLKNFRLYSNYNDSIFDNKNIRMNERSTFIEEISNQKIQINDLANQNELQSMRADKQRLFRVALLIFLLLIVLLFAVVLNRYSLKQKSFTLLNEKNEENKLLMREIHHRVKNNLQIISSLLGAEISQNHDNEKLTTVLTESQNKIRSMALIHQNLYKDENFARVAVSDYINDLINNIEKSFTSLDMHINFHLNITKKQIPIGLAVPLGLILNELITNAYKYAFPHNRSQSKNLISIFFEPIANTAKYSLKITDNGIGMTNISDSNYTTSFGIQLVNGLVDQLNGSISVSLDKGTAYNIVLEEP